MEPEYVWLAEERTFGVRLNYGAYVSLVRYTRAGIDYEIIVPNDEIEEYEGDDHD